MQDSVNAMEAPMKAADKKRRFDESVSSNLARQKRERAGAVPEVGRAAHVATGTRGPSAELQASIKGPPSKAESYLQANRGDVKQRAEAWQKRHHERIDRSSVTERKEDGTIATIENQKVQHDQEALINMRLMDAEEEDAIEKEISALGTDDRMAYDELRTSNYSHEEAMGIMMNKKFSVHAARETLEREQQTFHILSNASTPSSDDNKSIISEMTNTQSGGKMNSLRNAIVVSRTLFEKESSTSNLTPAEQAQSFIPFDPIFSTTRPTGNSRRPPPLTPGNTPPISHLSQQDSSVFQFAPSPGEPVKGRLTMGGGQQTSFGGDVTQYSSNPSSPASAAESETYYNRAKMALFSFGKSKEPSRPIPTKLHPSTHTGYNELGVITPRGHIVHQTAEF